VAQQLRGLERNWIAPVATVMEHHHSSISSLSTRRQRGIVVRQIIIDHRNLAFNGEIVDALAELMPKAQPIILSATGSEQEWRVARELADHFSARGYQIGLRNYVCEATSAPNNSITIKLFQDHIELKIAPFL
jgi:hypothetical protein